jgi:hypothetical protein
MPAAIPLAMIGGTIASSVIGSHAASSAANAQVDAANHAADLESQNANKALDFNKLQYGNSLNMMSPYYNMGTSSLGRLGFLMGLNPAQGLPPGVVNPNAPPPPTTGGGVGGPDIQDILNNIRNRNGAGGGPRPMTANSAMLPAGQNPFTNNPTLPGTPGTQQFSMRPPITSGGTNGTQFQMNPPITSGGTPGGTPGGQPGAAGLLGANGQPQTETNPLPNGLGTLPQNTTTASTNQGGTGQVPQTGGSTLTGNFAPPPNLTGEAMFNPNDPNQGLSPDGSAPGGGTFGSLSRNFGEQWKAPTGVTEVNDPGYQFRINQGLQAFQNSAAARGKLVSGDTAKGLNDYAQNSASGEFQNVYNRSLNDYTTRYNAFNQDQNTQFNRFAALAGLGQTAAGQLANVGLGTAGNNSSILLNSGAQIGQDYKDAGAARGSGYVGSANAVTGGINNIAMLLAMMQKNGSSAGAGGNGV